MSALGNCLQSDHVPPWSQVFLGRQFEFPRIRDTGLDYVTISGTVLYPASHALICLRRLMSAGLVGGDICSLPCHVDTAQGFVPIPYPFHYVTCLFDFSLDCGMTALLPFPCLSGVESVIMSELKPSGQHSHQAGGEQRGVQSLAQETKSTCFERPPSRLSLSQPLLEGAEV